MLGCLSGEARPAPAQQAAVEKLLILIHLACAPLLSAPSALYHACHGIDGAEITSQVFPARAKLFSGRRRSAFNLAADLLLPPVCISCRKRRRSRAALRRLLAQ